jgi:hypothetical protein
MENGEDCYLEAMDFVWDREISEKLGTAGSEASFFGSGTDFGMTERSNNWMMIHHRTYSNESGNTDGPFLSTPSDGVPEWTYTNYSTAGEEIDGPALQSLNENLFFLQDVTGTSN